MIRVSMPALTLLAVVVVAYVLGVVTGWWRRRR